VASTTIIFDCPVPPWTVVAGGVVALGAAILFLRRDAAHIARLPRALILAIMAVAAVMLVGLALSPTLVRSWPDPEKPRCAILVDASRSMLLADAYSGATADWLAKRIPPAAVLADGPTPPKQPRLRRLDKVTREAVARALLAGGADDWLAAIESEFDVSAWRFSGPGLLGVAALALRPTQGDPEHGRGVGPEAPEFAVDPEGYSTALGDALEAVAAGTGAARPRAVVLITDGAWNAGRDPSEVARRLGQLGTAVFAVGLGDPDPPRDAAVVDLKGPKSALLGDEVLLAARVATTGMGSVRLPVELVSDGRVIESKSVATLPSGQPVNVNFTFVPDTPGRRRFEVRIPKQEGERSTENNRAGLSLDVVERKINILLADGEPRWEFRFIRNVLERDPAVKVSIFLARQGVGPTAGGAYVAELPKEKKDLAAYDLVILGDVPRDKLPDEFLTEVADLVRRRGGALIVVAGRREQYRQLAGTPLAQILPVSLDIAPGKEARTAEPFSPELTQEGLGHLVTRLADGAEENEAAWLHLPRLTWSASVAGLAPGASALLVHPYRIAGASKMPLVAVHRVGDGKVMFCGIDETWRWRKSVGDTWHYRFWAQAVRWLVKKQFAEGDPRGRLSIDRTECDVGETVEVEAYCLGPDGFPLQGASVWLKVTDGEGRSQRLAMQPAPGGWGIYRTAFTPSAPASYKMQPIVSAYGQEPLASSVALQVARVDLEKEFLAENVAALGSIAAAGHTARMGGGKVLKPDEVGQLPGLLAARKEPRMLTVEYSPCRHWAYYSLLAVALGTAWLIRKRSGLA